MLSNIIIWRHAEAELALDHTDEADMRRALSNKGLQQARRMARWLKEYLPKDTLLLCSPALRCVQTAETLNYKITINQSLDPSANLQKILDVLTSVDSKYKNLVLVGHQPWLGQCVGHLIGAQAELNIKKGAIWWLRQSLKQSENLQTMQYGVLTVQTPSLLSK
jgi:phosphohistidine phosphatase